MDFNVRSKTVSGSVAGKYFNWFKEIHEKHGIKTTAMLQKGIEYYVKEFNINVDGEENKAKNA